MIATIIQVTPPVQPAGKKYFQLEVNFKNNETGKIGGTKLFSFLNPTLFNTVKELKLNDQIDVKLDKNEKGYWEWKEVTKLEGVVADAVPAKSATKDFAAASNDRYETKEERALRQALITRQSSAAQAVNILSVGAKSPPKLEEVLAVAEELDNWVHRRKAGVEGIAKDTLEQEFEGELGNELPR
jgi:hypothetical protein